ncbi:uncharacterized protein LOC108029005 [Drosophila biarmipes]|uniref:uncharacterized protein LOC108029005 n=1 Tax=Drosophila biarmipes TaxID=125945 RepID=UPI0007E6A1AE|nr:uncharacterized protein LOC108029005 [Drosophila biarmipes]
MKRHIPKVVDDQSSSSPSPSPIVSPMSSPESSPTSRFPILYVDVVKKNQPNLEMLPPPPRPQVPAPEFSIFREDFPALPGTATVRSVPAVPDDWTAMLSDGEQVEPGRFRDIVIDSEANVNVGCSEAFLPKNQNPELQQDMEFLPQVYGYAANPPRFDVSLIFGKQFLHEGVRQRAINSAHKASVPHRSTSGFHPPPGFEESKIFARLKTTNSGMPLGGVNLELGSSLYDRVWQMNFTPPGAAVEGSFGMLGLARRLGSAQRNPQLMTHIFGSDVPPNVGPGGATNDAHSTFAGPFEGGRLNPHEISHNVPLNYLLAGRLNLQHPKTEEMQVELLFFFFYTFTGDLMQMLAAAELAERGWRYHKFERLWIKRQEDNPNYTFRGFQEAGEYNYFNMCQWKILPRHFQLEPDQLERTLSKEELYELHGYHPQMTGL